MKIIQVTVPNTTGGFDVVPITDRVKLNNLLFKPLQATDYYAQGVDRKVDVLQRKVDRLEALFQILISSMEVAELTSFLQHRGFDVKSVPAPGYEFDYGDEYSIGGFEEPRTTQPRKDPNED